jgi:hypothetical protein
MQAGCVFEGVGAKRYGNGISIPYFFGNGNRFLKNKMLAFCCRFCYNNSASPIKI